MCVSEPVLSRESKNYFYFCVMPKNTQNRNLKKWRHQWIRFLGYMFSKHRYINLKFGVPDFQAWFYKMLYGFLKTSKLYDLRKKLDKKFRFLVLGGKTFFENQRYLYWRTSYSTSFVAFYLHFAENRCFWWFFKHLSIFDQKQHDIGPLTSI